MSTKGLLSEGWSSLSYNKRYIIWFWLLNLTLAEFGTASFRRTAHALLDHSLLADRLVNGLDKGVLIDFLDKPEFGTMSSMTAPALYFALLFFLATTLFLPGVFAGYAATYRLPREHFFRVCGQSLWRFLRIVIVAGIVVSLVAGLLVAANNAIVMKASESTNERLPFELRMIGLAVIFLVMTILRIWFDLAEVDTVLNHGRPVGESLTVAFLHTFRNLWRLLASYVVVTIVAAIVLAGGLWIWMRFLSPQNVFGAFVIAQITLLLFLIPRFWQRGIAVSCWQQTLVPALRPFQPSILIPAEPADSVATPPLPPTEPL